jgi:uncharacterized membrane protein
LSLVTALARSFVLGFACGLRSLAGLTSLAFTQGRQECAGCVPAPLSWARTDVGRLGLATASIGELIADKTSLLSARTEPLPLAGRIALGAFSGLLAVRSTRVGQRASLAIVGAALGGIGGVAGSHAGYRARRFATHDLGLPDLPVALAEDALAYSLAVVAAGS